MLRPLNRPAACAPLLTVFLVLGIAACSSGDLGRSEAKKKLSKTVAACDPCYVPLNLAEPMAQKLVQLGYLDSHTFQLTPLGQKILGENALLRDPVPGPRQIYVAAFKKEIDEVTGIAANTRRQGIVDVHFTDRVIPLSDFFREPQNGLEMLRLGGFARLNDLSSFGTVEQSNGKLVAFHTSGLAQFKKYDDGWRIELSRGMSPWSQLNTPKIGGFAESDLQSQFR